LWHFNETSLFQSRFDFKLFSINHQSKTTQKMKNLLLVCFILTMPIVLSAKDKPKEMTHEDSLSMAYDNIESTFKYQTGTVTLEDGIAKINVPKGFHFLGKEDAEKVVYELWGNPRGSSIAGLLTPDNQKILSENSWAFIITFDDMGYVSDEDADKINYDDLLKDIQKEEVDENKEREKQGFPAIHIVGWAQKPYYDKTRKVLHWAKELAFGGEEDHTINYNVRVLGRKGVLVLNAVGNMGNLPDINKSIDGVLSSVEFTQGNSYKEFQPSIDKVAAWTIGGLVAGKVMAKVGILAVIAKFGKVIALAIGGAGSAVWRFIRGRRKEEEEV
jgi:uncharacterized membrane-anchored protein